MPNKMIYVSEGDLPTFERAQELAGGNLSAVIARALRLFVETEEARAQHISEVTVEVGREGKYKRKQFRGRILAKQRLQTPDYLLINRLVYQTAKGKLAVYTKEIPHWSSYKEDDWTTWNWSTRDYRLDVYESLEELRPHIPASLYEEVAQALNDTQEPVEVLDI